MLIDLIRERVISCPHCETPAELNNVKMGNHPIQCWNCGIYMSICTSVSLSNLEDDELEISNQFRSEALKRGFVFQRWHYGMYKLSPFVVYYKDNCVGKENFVGFEIDKQSKKSKLFSSDLPGGYCGPVLWKKPAVTLQDVEKIWKEIDRLILKINVGNK